MFSYFPTSLNLYLFVFSELSLKPSLNSLLIPPHAQQQNSGGAGTSNPGTPSSGTPTVVDGAVASVSAQVS